jgi:hypothetical protein
LQNDTTSFTGAGGIILVQLRAECPNLRGNNFFEQSKLFLEFL